MFGMALSDILASFVVISLAVNLSRFAALLVGQPFPLPDFRHDFWAQIYLHLTANIGLFTTILICIYLEKSPPYNGRQRRPKTNPKSLIPLVSSGMRTQ